MDIFMKTCVSTYSYGGYMSDSKLGVLGCIDHAASEGFDGIEFVEGRMAEGVAESRRSEEDP